MTLVAARAYRLDIIDGVYNDFKDERACARSASAAAPSAWTARR